MSVVPINRASPEQIAAFRAGAVTHAKKQSKPKPILLNEAAWMFGDGFTLQLPLVLKGLNHGGWNKQAANAISAKHRETVLAFLRSHFSKIDRDRIRHFTMVRISQGELDDDDNLRAAFKSPKDSTCAWIVKGDEEFNRRTIGNFDKQLKRTGRVTWNCEQETCEYDRRKQGIQIRFRLG